MENKVIHRAATRGKADHGWLQSHHTFSFAGYHDPARVHFGAIRVLNDDAVAPGMGFGTHAHDNMEIISIPLEGDLQHRDSMGNVAVIRKGDVQVMSAGSGITHSEMNHNRDKPVKFLQIWVFPEKRDIAPRYGQVTLKEEDRRNRLQEIVRPGTGGEGTWIRQQAWFHMGRLDKGTSLRYDLKKPGNGVYAFILEGSMSINDEKLDRRDGMGITGATALQITANENSEILLMEVPMSV
jgi:quercetin 2,3-dioxygenase